VSPSSEVRPDRIVDSIRELLVAVQ
jgi:hypothetical protein